MANTNKRINVVLSTDEIDFIKWLAKRDEIKEGDEMAQIFQTELNALRVLYAEEYFKETGRGSDYY